MKKKLMGFGDLTLEKTHFLQSMGLCGGCEYAVEFSHSQVMLTNTMSETIVVSDAVMDLLEWFDV